MGIKFSRYYGPNLCPIVAELAWERLNRSVLWMSVSKAGISLRGLFKCQEGGNIIGNKRAAALLNCGPGSCRCSPHWYKWVSAFISKTYLLCKCGLIALPMVLETCDRGCKNKGLQSWLQGYHGNKEIAAERAHPDILQNAQLCYEGLDPFPFCGLKNPLP